MRENINNPVKTANYSFPVIYLITISLFILPAFLFSQNFTLNFNHLTRDDGLPSNRVNHIMEDSLGFIWFATEEGLSKYDAYNFETFKNFPGSANSLHDVSVDYILEDIKKPNLWIASRQGLVYFDRFKRKFSLVLSKDTLSPDSRNIIINSLCFDKNNVLWIGTSNGLFTWNPPEKKLKTLIKNNGKESSKINTIFKDNKSNIWIGSGKGVFKFDYTDSTFTRYCKDKGINKVRVIMQDSKNNFWIGTENTGLYGFNGAPGKTIKKHISTDNGFSSSNRVFGIIEDTPGKFFVLVRDDGLYLYDENNDKLKYYPYDIYNPEGINSKALITGFKSSQNIIWIGTYNSGVNYLDKARKRFILYKVNFKENGLFNNNIRALAEDSDGYIWVGTKEGGGLSRFDKNKGTFKNYRAGTKNNTLKDDYIFSICELDKKNLLLGTFREGLAIFNKSTDSFSYFKHNDNKNSLADNRVYVVFKDKEGEIWVGNYINLQKFDPVKKTFKTVNKISRPRCLIQQGKDTLWIGTKDHGIFLFNKKTGTIKRFVNNPNDSNTVSCNDIYALQIDKYGNLWVGTKMGLDKFNLKNNKIYHYNENNGLSSNWVRSLQIDDENNIWISTSNGLNKLDYEKNIFHHYDVQDGLQGNEFEPYVSLKTHDGYLLFGGHNGFNIFKPEEITENKRIPPVYITGLSLFNNKIDVSKDSSLIPGDILFLKNITLKHNQSAITLSYVALNYTSPGKNQYKYKLEGFDNGWIFAGTNRKAVYTNIPPGEYTFRVIGSNNDNYWNTKGASLHITILPPPWKTIWAYIIYIIILTLLFLFFRKIMITRIQQKNLLELERRDKQRIQQMNQTKLRFFTNISHEIRTPLTLISSPLEKLKKDGKLSPDQRYLVEIMSKNTKRLLSLLQELMDFRKAEQGLVKLHITPNNIIKNIEDNIACFEFKIKEKGVTLIFENNTGNVETWYDKDIFNKIAFNLLSNAVKFVDKGGTIKITVDVSEDGILTFKVANTGKSINEKDYQKIFERFYHVDKADTEVTGTGIGLAFTKRMVEVHKGSINVESNKNGFTVFTVKIPVNKSFYKDEKIGSEEPISHFTETEDNEIKDIPGINGNENGKSKSILIVEDSDDLRNYLKTLFEKEFKVYKAKDGKEGLEIAETQMPDIIISDIMMPEIDGIELCARIKQHHATSHIPVILLTAKADVEHKIKGAETGADFYIEKPFDDDYLKAVVNNLILQREKLKRKYSKLNIIEEIDKIENTGDKKFIEKVFEIIKANISNPGFSVEKLARELGMSRTQLFRKFRALFDNNPSEIIKSERMKYARKLLLQNEYNVNEVAERAGFKSTSYFITSFKEYYGETPSRFIQKNKK